MADRTGRKWQFSLLTLLLTTSGVALICLALRSPNEVWAAIVFSALLAALALAVLTAIYRAGRTRAFALGFLVLGAGYFGLVLYAERPETYGQPRLPTTRWAFTLFMLLHQENGPGQYAAGPYSTVSYAVQAYAPVPPTIPAGSSYVPAPMATPVTTYVQQVISPPQFSAQTFLDITHQSLALLLGVIGGIAAQWLYATRREDLAPAAAA